MAKQQKNILLSSAEYTLLKKQAAEYEQLMHHLQQAQQARLEAEKKAERLAAENAVLEQKLEEEKSLFRKFVRRYLHRKSERYKTGPLTEKELELQVEQIFSEATKATTKAAPTPALTKTDKAKPADKKKRNHPGRNPIPDHLPRLNVLLEPSEDISGCTKIGEEYTEELEYIPGCFFVRRFIRPKYVCPNNTGVIIAPAPTRVIEKGIPGPMLLTQLLVNKYQDHLPLYRQQAIYKRGGVNINEMTINGWVRQGIDLLTALYERVRSEVMNTDYLMADETTIRVMDKDKVGSTHLGYYWVYMNPENRSVLFIYEMGRGGVFVREHLKQYRGYLQTDAYAAYDTLAKENVLIILLGCWAHARRKFIDALDVDKEQAEWFLHKIQLLYDLERFARRMKLGAEERLALRGHAIPWLEEIKAKMEELAPTLPPKNMLAVAIRYAQNNWKELMAYTTDGRLEIDNNLVENSIRPIALGRKNYLFAGDHEAAQRGAIMYTLLASCKANKLNPVEYLADVLDKIVTRKINDIDDLLPWNWKNQHNNPDD